MRLYDSCIHLMALYILTMPFSNGLTASARFFQLQDSPPLPFNNSRRVSEINNNDDSISSLAAQFNRLTIKRYANLHSVVTLGTADDTEQFLREKTFVDEIDKYGETPLMRAAQLGKTDIMTLLLKWRANVNAVDRYGRTPLTMAIQHGKKSAVELLLEWRAKINAIDKYGRTALIIALEEEKKDIVNFLLNERVDVNASNNYKETALIMAIQKGWEDIVNRLLAKGAHIRTPDKYGQPPLIVAAQWGNVDVMRALLSWGADIEEADTYGQTPLMVAIQRGKTNAVEFLIRNAANIKAVDKYGNTPFINAQRSRLADIIQLLIKEELNIRERGKALIVAARQGNMNDVKALLKRRADINAKNEDGETPLIAAVYRKQTDVVRFLLEKRADVNAIDKYGDTALAMAFTQNDTDIIKLLLDRATDNERNMALVEAAQRGQTPVVEFLLAREANINSRDDYRRTPLMMAAQQGHANLVNLLLEKEADMNAVNNFGETAFMMAAQRGKTDIIRLLLTKINAPGFLLQQTRSLLLRRDYNALFSVLTHEHAMKELNWENFIGEYLDDGLKQDIIAISRLIQYFTYIKEQSERSAVHSPLPITFKETARILTDQIFIDTSENPEGVYEVNGKKFSIILSADVKDNQPAFIGSLMRDQFSSSVLSQLSLHVNFKQGFERTLNNLALPEKFRKNNYRTARFEVPLYQRKGGREQFFNVSFDIIDTNENY